jgi:hypothetical protein
MADLEEHAFRRDKRFVLRLLITLGLALLGGMFVYGNLTRGSGAGCMPGASTPAP